MESDLVIGGADLRFRDLSVGESASVGVVGSFSSRESVFGLAFPGSVKPRTTLMPLMKPPPAKRSYTVLVTHDSTPSEFSHAVVESW